MDTTDLFKLSATEIATLVSSRRISAEEMTRQALARLSAVNPVINAVVQEFPEQAIAESRNLDERISRGDSPGLLAGVPVTVKVNIDQAGQATTNGLVLQKNHVASHDSPVVTNLKKAGAIIIGRTNTPAFSIRWFTRNTVHGHTRNPRNPALTPGGSSGGAAAAVAAGIGAIGHGTDIAGSIRYPAYACGLHGLRPTPGRVPAVNLSLPDRHVGSQLTAVSGPIARTVLDVQAGYLAMIEGNALDPWWVPVSYHLGAYEKSVVVCEYPDGLETDPEIVETLHQSARYLEEAGWQIVEVKCPPMREAMDLQLRLWLSEFHYDRGNAIRQENDPDANFVYQQIISEINPPTLESFMELLQRRVALARKWQGFLTRYPLILCPVSAKLPFPDSLDIQSPESFRFVLEAQLTQIAIPFLGVPAMTVTTGVARKLPVGVQLVSARFREDILLDAAQAIESRCDGLGIADEEDLHKGV